MKETKKNNKKLLAFLAVILAIITLIAGTFAWIQSRGSVANRLSTGQITDGSVVLQEVFTPPESWDPGITVNKQVSVINTGSGNVLVRVSFEELMTLLKKGGESVRTNTYNKKTDNTDIPLTEADPLDNWIPVIVDITSFSAANGWTALGAGQIDTSKLENPDVLTGSDVTVMMRQEGGSFGYFAYRTIDSGNDTIYQKIDLGEVNTILYTQADREADIIPADKNIGDFKKTELLGVAPKAIPNANPPVEEDKNIKFYWYEGRVYDDNTWSGTREYAVKNTNPLKPAFTSYSPLDTKLMNILDKNPMVTLNFGTYDDGGTAKSAVTTDLANAVNEKKWYYNEADGYFYYMGRLEPGMATKLLLSSLKMSDEASVEHSLMDYKLVVVYDAIQNTEAALRSDTGWSLTTTDFPDDNAFWLAIKSFCDN